MAYLSYEQIDLSTATVLTVDDLTVPERATQAELQAQDAGDVNYTMDDSTDPSITSGMILQAGLTPKTFLIEDVKKIRFIESAGNTKLNIHYFAGRDI